MRADVCAMLDSPAGTEVRSGCFLDALAWSCVPDPRPLPAHTLVPFPPPTCDAQLGTGDTLDRLVPTEVPLALESEAGQLVRAMQVQCGAQHTLALVQVQGESQVRSVGGNSYGELGLGDRLERHRFHPIPGLRVSSLLEQGRVGACQGAC